jgi:hypothetical protein
MESNITVSNQPAIIKCDGKCDKAWGINEREKIKLSDDPDDYCYLSDRELGLAPLLSTSTKRLKNKPTNKINFPTSWCICECERSVISEPDTPYGDIDVPDFNNRVYNIPNNH